MIGLRFRLLVQFNESGARSAASLLAQLERALDDPRSTPAIGGGEGRAGLTPGDVGARGA